MGDNSGSLLVANGREWRPYDEGRADSVDDLAVQGVAGGRRAFAEYRADLADFLGRQRRSGIGVEAEILVAFVSDEFGPSQPAQHNGETLKAHSLFVEDEFVECPFDVYSLDGHLSSTCALKCS